MIERPVQGFGPGVVFEMMTAEEYLTLELGSEKRQEFWNGRIVKASANTPEHNEIAGSFFYLLKSALRKQPYSIFITDQRLWIPQANCYTYPDVMVTPCPPERQAGRNDTVVNPLLIAEVLSTSTQGYDRGEKFAHYRTIETLREYVLIDQYRAQVEVYVKQEENQWLFREFSGLDARFGLETLEVEIALADLYEAIDLD